MSVTLQPVEGPSLEALIWIEVLRALEPNSSYIKRIAIMTGGRYGEFLQKIEEYQQANIIAVRLRDEAMVLRIDNGDHSYDQTPGRQWGGSLANCYFRCRKLFRGK